MHYSLFLHLYFVSLLSLVCGSLQKKTFVQTRPVLLGTPIVIILANDASPLSPGERYVALLLDRITDHRVAGQTNVRHFLRYMSTVRGVEQCVILIREDVARLPAQIIAS